MEVAPLDGPLTYLRARWGWTYLRGLAGAWASWDAFADHHGLDPEQPTDTALVAFVLARTRAGAAWGTVDATLRAVRVTTDGTETLLDGSVTVPATRLLADLYQAGTFDPAWQAPLVTLGQVLAMVEAGDAAGAFLAAVTYLGGLRPGEWSAIDREHLQVRDGRVTMLLPRTKTGDWQRVAIEALPGTPLDPAPLASAYLAARGEAPGPLIADRDGHRLAPETFQTRLRALARTAGVTPFTPYSLRRSMAVHADLLGIPGPVVRARLRHAPGSQVYRRYIEPLLALMDRDGAQTYYLSTESHPAAVPVIHRARPRAPYLTKYAFAAGSLTDLLTEIDMAHLRVPVGLAGISRDGIVDGRRALRRWADHAREWGWDPLDPPGFALGSWFLHLSGQIQAASAAHLLQAVRIGWLDATGSDAIPGWEAAAAAAAGAVRQQARFVDPEHKSRLSEPDDLVHLCDAAGAAVPAPSARWAATVLSWRTRARSGIEVLDRTSDHVTVLVDGSRRMVLPMAGHGVLDPVTAAEVLGTERQVTIVPEATKAAAVRAGAARSRALRNRLALVLLAGSGARPSDMARARSQGVEIVPGGLAVVLGVAKGKAPRGLGRARVLWAPHRPGAQNPVTAWQEWAQWWPVPAKGPLLPAVVDRINAERSLSAAAVSAAVTRGVKRARLAPGLSAYGFRYARATELHLSGASDETVAEALGHDDLDVARGYIRDFDPFADRQDEDFLRRLA